MIDALVEWGRGPWGITVLVAVAWFGVSCVFSVILGRLMRQLAPERVRDRGEALRHGRPGQQHSAVESLQRRRQAIE